MAAKHDIDPSFLERMRLNWERRQESLASASPKSLFDITKDLRKNMFKDSQSGTFKEGNMLKARAKRFAGTNHVVGNTVFSFDKDGLTQVMDAGYAKYDYETLLKMNGVHAVTDEAPKAASPAKAPKTEDKEHKDEPKKAEVQNKPSESMEKDRKESRSGSEKPGKAEKVEKPAK